MILSRGWSWFLVGAGVFNWVIWLRFAVAIWDDRRAWSGAVGHSSPTAFLIVHAVLIVAALAIGTVVGVLGIRGLRFASKTAPAEQFSRSGRGDRL